jgi:hypothetical protein
MTVTILKSPNILNNDAIKLNDLSYLLNNESVNKKEEAINVNKNNKNEDKKVSTENKKSVYFDKDYDYGYQGYFIFLLISLSLFSITYILNRFYIKNKGKYALVNIQNDLDTYLLTKMD